MVAAWAEVKSKMLPFLVIDPGSMFDPVGSRNVMRSFMLYRQHEKQAETVEQLMANCM